MRPKRILKNYQYRRQIPVSTVLLSSENFLKQLPSFENICSKISYKLPTFQLQSFSTSGNSIMVIAQIAQKESEIRMNIKTLLALRVKLEFLNEKIEEIKPQIRQIKAAYKQQKDQLYN